MFLRGFAFVQTTAIKQRHFYWLAFCLLATLIFLWPAGSAAQGTATTVSGASFDAAAPVAPDSIAAVYGARLATQPTPAPPGLPLPTTLAGTTVKVNGRDAGLFYVSLNQVNFLLPPETEAGTANVVVRAGDGTMSTGTVQVSATRPGLFTANSNGQGVVSAVALRVLPNNTNLCCEAVFQYNSTAGAFQTRAISLGPPGERVFLILYATGVRRAAAGTVKVILGGNETTPTFVGAAPGFAGLDQINVELPRTLSGQVSVAVIVQGSGSSNVGIVEIAAPSSGSSTVSSVTPTPVTASEPLTVSGNGFPATPDVFIVDGDQQALRTQIINSTGNVANVLVPFGAGTGQVRVGEAIGPSNSRAVTLRTSISTFVQDTSRQGIQNVTMRIPASSATPDLTSADGSAVMAESPVGDAVTFEADATTVPNMPYPPHTYYKTAVRSARDKQYGYIELQANIGPGVIIGGAALQEAVEVPSAVAAETSLAEPNQVIQNGGVTLTIPAGATVRFPAGTGNRLTLTAFERGRTPLNLPVGHFSSAIAQISPFGAVITPGARLSFPNLDNIPANTAARLFRYDQNLNSRTLGNWVDAGAAVVTADGARIETAVNAVQETSYYFVSIQRPTATIFGRVLTAEGRAVQRALAVARGQSVFTDSNGGFVLRNVPVLGANDLVNVEVSYHRPDKRVDRAGRPNIAIVPNGLHQIGADLIFNSDRGNRPPVLSAPSNLTVYAGDTREFEFFADDPDPNQTVQVSLGGNASSFSRLTALTSGPGLYRLTISPNVELAGEFVLGITALDSQGARATQNIPITVTRLGGGVLFAQTQGIALNEGAERIVTLTGGPAGTTLRYLITSLPRFGALTGNAPTLLYTPAREFYGIDSFTFRVTNGNATSEPATVYIVVAPVNDPPQLDVLDKYDVDFGQTLSFFVRATGPEQGQKLVLSAATLPAGARFEQIGGALGRFIWTPTANQLGSFNVVFRVVDDGKPALTTTRTVVITVNRGGGS